MKKIKNKCIFLLYLLTVLVTIAPYCADVVAAELPEYSGTAVLSTDSEIIYPGDAFIVNVSIKTNDFDGINTFTAKVECDDEYVKYKGVVTVGNWKAQSNSVVYDSETMTYAGFRIIDPAGCHNKEIIVQLMFEAVSETSSNGINITLKQIEAQGPNFEWISSENGTIAETKINIIVSERPEEPEPEEPEVPDILPYDYRIDYNNYRLVIDKGMNSIFFLSTINAKGNIGAPLIFEAEESVVKIDLSSYSVSKEWTFILYGDVDKTPSKFILTPRIKKVKASYNPLGYSVDERIVFTADEDEIDIEELEVRTSNGNWEDAAELTEEQLNTYAVTGTTLYFRIKAVENESPYSAEAKVKIPKLANAPKVTINYSKLTIKFPSKSEFRLAHAEQWKDSPSGVIKLNKLTDIMTSGLYLEVRKMETEKKPASKYSVIEIAKQGEAPLIGHEDSVIQIIRTTASGKTISCSIKNNSNTMDVEYAVVDKNTDISTIDLSKQKWKKLPQESETILKEKDVSGKVIIARYAPITAKNTVTQFASQIAVSDIIIWVK